jgi:exodeoxyribonuclease-3
VPTPLRVATTNVNGIRAAFRKGMGDWLAQRGIDVLTLQEVRASTDDVTGLLDDSWHIVHDPCDIAGRAGVAIASRIPFDAHRMRFDDEASQSSGRWLEVDLTVNGQALTVVSTYVHSGEVGTPRQEAKWAFLDVMTERMRELGNTRELALVTGDLNVGHRELDIKNWKGNVKKAGFLPRERAYFDRFFGPAGETVVGVDGSEGPGLGWVDVGRTWAGEVEGPYSWWSNRGQAFDNDTGWRIDYQVATPALAATVKHYTVDRAASYDARWSDHAPVVTDYEI